MAFRVTKGPVFGPTLHAFPKLGYGANRRFTTSPTWKLRTSEMRDVNLRDLRVNKERLMSDLHHTCQWGAGTRWGPGVTETGMSRLSLSDADKTARDWFVETTRAAGCETTVDEMGNIFAVRPGINNDVPPTFVGSHLDTQPSGGRYDGILGVTAGVEMLKVLNENWVETEFPVGVVNWTNEEGARFPISMVSSSVWAGLVSLEQAHSLQEVGTGTSTMLSELKRIGYFGSMPCSYRSMPMAAHFELHIEQGPVLEAEQCKIGIVKGAQAYRWYTVEVQGHESHTGTTPFFARADALLAAAKMILHSHKVATKLDALASTGIITAEPGSTNTIPGTVRFSLDIRAPKDSTVDAIEAELRKSFQDIASGKEIGSLNHGGTPGKPCTLSIREDSISPAANFHSDCIQCVSDSATSFFGSDSSNLTKEMVSGAGHDSVQTNYICPTAMIFIPCKDGVSHNPKEYSTAEDCSIGAQVLLGAVLRFDQLRAKKNGNSLFPR